MVQGTLACVLLVGLLAGGLALWLVPGAALGQDGGFYDYQEALACRDPELGPNHEECVCFVLRLQDEDYFRGYQAEHGVNEAPNRYPSNLRYENEQHSPLTEISPGVLNPFVRDKEFKAQCSLTYMREDIRRAWWFAVAVASGLLTMSFVWGGYVYMQESAAAVERASSRAILFRVMAGFAIVVMAYFLYAGFSNLFVDLSETTIWTPDYEDTIRRPDW